MSGSLDTGVLRWGVTVFGYLSPSVLCLFFLVGHRIHVASSNKQGLVSEFRADPCQEFLRARNLLEKGKLGGSASEFPHGRARSGGFQAGGSGLRVEARV